jgi:glycosyltransferase involved in cell wall biosynthesis
LRILHLSQYFPPEAGAVQVRAAAMARYLTDMGHHVTVVTEMPNHPVGIVFPEYRGKLFVRERFQGIDVVRVWVYTSPNKSFRSRLGFYLSYMVNSILRGLVLRGHYDVVFANSPPLFVGVAGSILSIARRIPFVFEVQDLWPESAVDMGELRNPRVIQMSTWLEERCYQRATKIVTVAHGIFDRLIERDIPSSKLALVENGSNTDLFKPEPSAGDELRSHWGLQDKFIVFYGGIIGLAQGLETIVETARLLRDQSDVHFIMVGEGPRRHAIEKLLDDYDLPNFTLLPGQPLEAMPAYLAAADVALAPLRDLPVFAGARPTKIFDAWACLRPVIVSARGEACRVVREAAGGLCAQPETPPDIAHAILSLRDNQTQRHQMATNGYNFVQENYSLKAMATKLEQVLREGVC